MKKNRIHPDQVHPGSPVQGKIHAPKVCFQEMVGQLNGIVFMLNTQGRLVYPNPAWQHRTGYSQSGIN